jgi:hypothetical protein
VDSSVSCVRGFEQLLFIKADGDLLLQSFPLRQLPRCSFQAEAPAPERSTRPILLGGKLNRLESEGPPWFEAPTDRGLRLITKLSRDGYI